MSWTQSDFNGFQIGDRIITGNMLTLPDEFMFMLDSLIAQAGTIEDQRVITIDVEGSEDPITLAVCDVRLDNYNDHVIAFHPDELWPE